MRQIRMTLPFALKSKIPIGRLGKPDEIASIVVMLAKNAYMTNKVCSTVLSILFIE